MQRMTEQRGASTRDEIWLLEHLPVFTLGLNASPAHVLQPGSIPVVRVDRGGQVTYHGPGQLVVYTLIDLKRRQRGVRWLVSTIEQAVVDLLQRYGIEGRRRPRAPGVYVRDRKVCALGLRVRRGCSYHGLALNVDMDLEPFQRINPCGFVGLEVTQLADLGAPVGRERVAKDLLCHLQQRLEADVADGVLATCAR